MNNWHAVVDISKEDHNLGVRGFKRSYKDARHLNLPFYLDF